MTQVGEGETAYWVTDTGAGWLYLPLMFHSSREDMCMLTPEQCAFKSQHWLNWYQSDHQYGLPTIALLLAIITFCAIGALGDLIAPRSLRQWGPYRKTQAWVRFLAYKCFRISFLSWYSPSLGIILIGALGFIFFLVMTVAKRPYYWPNTEEVNYGGSPPVATRTGWMSLACLPFVLALGAKENPITVITRIPYEKLNIFHRWLSWAMYVLALVHTFPFIVYNRQQGEMGMQWGMSSFYWTGVIALIAQTWLSFASIGPLRNRFYEFFKIMHFLMGLVFFAFLFIHCGFTLSSVDYLIAAAVLYFVCWGSATLRTLFEHGPKPVPARLDLLPHNVVKVSVPTTSPWKPGQHIFLRFLSWDVHSLTAHPFTISSLPKRDEFASPSGEHEMVFYVHPRGGYTSRLASLAKQNPNRKVKVSLDGPYGGMKDRSLAAFNRSVIISGGAGAGFVLSVLEDVLRRQAMWRERDVRVVFCTKNSEHAAWFQEQVAVLFKEYNSTGVKIEVHITESGDQGSLNMNKEVSRSSAEADSGKNAVEEEAKAFSNSESEELVRSTSAGRPNARAIVEKAVESFTGGVGIAVCGPEAMLFDVRNAVAGVQGKVGPGGPSEVYLYSEHFGW